MNGRKILFPGEGSRFQFAVEVFEWGGMTVRALELGSHHVHYVGAAVRLRRQKASPI